MTRNRTDLQQRFEADGLSVAEWARANGYNVRTVRAVIYGTLKAKRGVSHEIAVKLGMKAEPVRSLSLRNE